MSAQTIEKEFSVSSTPRLRLENIRGSVEIIPGEDGVVKVKAVKHLHTGDPDHTTMDVNQADEGTVRVITRFDEKGFGFLGLRRPCRVDYNVSVPSRCSLKLSGVTNSTSVRGISGEIELTSVSGPLDLGDLSGPLEISTVSGKVRGQNLVGSLRLKTVSGNADLDDSRLESVICSTVSGAIRLHTPLEDGPYQFDSVSGGIHLRLPAAKGITVHSQTFTGRLVTGLPITQKSIRTGSKWVQILDGGIEIRHNSLSGNLHISLTGEQNIEGRSPSNQAHALDRVAVLDQIERGEISVEDALKILS
jgi:hypothetical protein